MDINEMISFAITIIAGFITWFLVPFLRRKTTAAQQELICFWTTIAVDAVEEILKSEPGEDKFAYVKNFLQTKGFNLTEQEIKIFIEQAVRELKRK